MFLIAMTLGSRSVCKLLCATLNNNTCSYSLAINIENLQLPSIYYLRGLVIWNEDIE